MIESYDPQTRAWAEREQADEERRRLERTEREGAPGPSCPDCGLPMARVAGPDGHGWTCVNCNAAGDPEGDHPEPLRPLHIRDFPASEYLFPRPSDPDADRPCSCDESLQLQAAVLELQNRLVETAQQKRTVEQRLEYCERRLVASEAEVPKLIIERDRLEARVRELEAENARTLQLWKDDESRGMGREAQLESEARALRSDNEEHVKRCYAAEAAAGALRERIERAIVVVERWHPDSVRRKYVLEALRAER